MKFSFYCLLFLLFSTPLAKLQAQTTDTTKTKNHLFVDVHYLPSGKVQFEDVATAHAKDLQVQNKYGVQFLKYWVDEAKGAVYCLSSAPDSAAITETHREAHGLLPQQTFAVTDGKAALPKGSERFFLDVHNLGKGKVTADAVAKAHEKDLAVQNKYGVRFLNYWVDEEDGVVLCLSQAPDASKVVQTHKEAHGLLPDSITAVKQGQ